MKNGKKFNITGVFNIAFGFLYMVSVWYNEHKIFYGKF